MSNAPPPQHYPPSPYQPEPSGGGGGKTWLVVLLVTLSAIAGCVLICCGGIFYVTNRVAYEVGEAGRNLAGDIGRAGAEATIRSSNFSDADKKKMIGQIERVSQAFKDKEIGFGDAASLMMELGESPIFAVSNLRQIEANYLSRSGLDAEQKTEAIRTMQRAARGLMEESITRNELNNCINANLMEWVEEEYQVHVDGKMETRTRMDQRYKSPMSDADLIAFFQSLNEMVDNADIPDEPYEADAAAEFKKIVDEALE